MTDEKRGRGRPRKETVIMPTTLESRQQETDEKELTFTGTCTNTGTVSLILPGQLELYNLATRIYVVMIEREPFLANNTDTAESAIRRAKLFLKVWEKEGEHV